MLSKFRFMVLLALLGLGAPSAYAVSAFDNFGPNYSTGTGFVFASGSDAEFGERTSGLQFTADASGFLMKLTLVASAKDNGRPNDGLRLTLYTDDGDLPGDALESVVLNDICYVDFDCPTGELVSASAIGTTLLSQGSTYWLLASSDLADADFSWYLTTENEPSLVYIENGFTGVLPFEFPPALRVEVTPEVTPVIPEPGTLFLLGVAAIGLALRRPGRKG